MARKSLESFIKWLDALNPTRSYLLGLFKLDKTLIKGSGHYLQDQAGTQYLDFLSQYGAVSLGHNHPELCAVLSACLAEQLPAMVQPLPSLGAQELAEELNRITPGELAHCIFTNSGAEAVEAGIKLARARTGRRGILSTVNGFHGKTLGALSATGRKQYQKPFGAPVPDFGYVPYGDLDTLETTLVDSVGQTAAFIVEPIQGEGGIVPAPPGYLVSAAALCRQHNVLFILDEIQTGLGRTGSLFAWPEGAGSPDILLLAKALGGGLFPIGACISTQKAWDHEFGLLHSSTFANNNLACKIGLKVIEILTRNDGALVREVARQGEYLAERLRDLHARYPSVIKAVRSKGLLAGVEFHPFTGDDSYTMSYFSHGDYLIALYAGYLLNEHKLLTAPVFNHSHVLRLEPPFSVGRPEIDRVIGALGVLCDVIERKDYCHLLRYLIGSAHNGSTRHWFQAPHPPNTKPSLSMPPVEKGRFAFLVHYTSERDFYHTDPSFCQFTPAEFESWKRYIEESAEPEIIYHLEKIRSAAGSVAEGWLIAIPMLASSMVRRGRQKMMPILRDALTIAKEKGAGILGLGGFTSIVSKGGESLVGEGIAITSGNVLTSVMTVDAILDVLRRVHLDLEDLHVVIVGATGSIGRLTALLLAGRVARLSLIGNPGSVNGESRCQAVTQEVLESTGARTGLSVQCGTDLEPTLPQADVVVLATNATQAVVQAHHLKPGAIVCDVARPQNVAEAVVKLRPDVLVFEGGLVQIPERIHFGPNLQGYPPGINLACLSECILLALEGDYSNHSIGQAFTLAEAEYLRNLAQKHGFRAAAPHWMARPLVDADFERFKSSVFGIAKARLAHMEPVTSR